jgi:hypothetical protein
LLNHLVCGGPVTAPHDEKYSWPTLAEDFQSREHPEIIPWAAAGLFKNLVIDPNVRSMFREETDQNSRLLYCLCEIYQDSPDAYEEEKAFTALYRLSWDSRCPNYHDYCDDLEGWTEAETGKTCWDLQNGKLCATMGETLGLDTGIKANDACCACGGGTAKSEDEVQKVEAAEEFTRILEL